MVPAGTSEGAEGLSHVGADGKAKMVDVAGKAETSRRALARARLRFGPGIADRVLRGDLPKGAVLETARLAGIMGAKRTADLIPMCHPLRISEVAVRFETDSRDPDLLEVLAEVRAVDRTGVEMEALTVATTAALTVYDMVKAVDRGMVIEEVLLLEKEGGKGGPWQRAGAE